MTFLHHDREFPWKTWIINSFQDVEEAPGSSDCNEINSHSNIALILKQKVLRGV